MNDSLEEQIQNAIRVEKAVSKEMGKREQPGVFDRTCSLLQAIGPIAIAIVGAYFTWKQFSTSERNQKAANMAQLQSARESADISLRADMFKALVGQFFPNNLSLQDKARMLTLFERNFHDYFSAGPLFEMMVEGSTNQETRQAIFDSVKSIAARQELQYAGGLGQTRSIALTNGQSTHVTAGDLSLTIKVDGIDPTNNRVHVLVSPGSKDSVPQFNAVPFHVNYFDMPLIDNTKIQGDEVVPFHRFAVTLKDIISTNGPGNIAQMDVSEIDHKYLASLDRPDVEEFVRRAGGQKSPPANENTPGPVPVLIGTVVVLCIAVAAAWVKIWSLMEKIKRLPHSGAKGKED